MLGVCSLVISVFSWVCVLFYVLGWFGLVCMMRYRWFLRLLNIVRFLECSSRMFGVFSLLWLCGGVRCGLM